MFLISRQTFDLQLKKALTWGIPFLFSFLEWISYAEYLFFFCSVKHTSNIVTVVCTFANYTMLKPKKKVIKECVCPANWRQKLNQDVSYNNKPLVDPSYLSQALTVCIHDGMCFRTLSLAQNTFLVYLNLRWQPVIIISYQLLIYLAMEILAALVCRVGCNLVCCMNVSCALSRRL